MSAPTKIEKQNLEAHVELCAERYKSLEDKLDNLEQRMDKLETHMVDIKNCLVLNDQRRTGQLIRYGITIIGVLTAAVIAFLSKGVIGL